MEIITSEQQIKTRALELFNEYGSYRTRAALNVLCDEVSATGYCTSKNVSFHYAVEKIAWSVYPTPEWLVTDVNNISSLIDKKATIVKMGDFGFVQNFHCVIEKVYVQNYAQYDNVIFIQYRQKRKRTSYNLMVLPYSNIAIYAGELTANAKTVAKVVSKTDDATITNMGTSFDEKHFTGAIASLTETPIFIHNK